MNSAHLLILASNSPRRQELLKQAGYAFEVVTYQFDEILPEHIAADGAAEYLAKEKNRFYRSKLENQVIITADTTVVLDNVVYNKPIDASEALEMINRFSGKTHEVISGVCISNLKKSISFSSKTKVTFSDISEQEAQFYVDQYQPLDKAGAYGIQEWIGLTKISSVEGSYFNVVGLPIHQLYEVLKKEFNVSPLD